MIKIILVSVLVFSSHAYANETLLKQKNCLSCHAMDKKFLGPSFLDIKSRYGNDSQAVKKLTQKITTGGAGSWGVLPMPPNPQINEAEAKELAQWILKLP